ncbi:MAG: tetratricopeptide repeat protein, partial [Thermoguttaceae bacterium]
LHPSSFYWLSLAAFILAMLSKGSMAVLPVLLLGIVWWLCTVFRETKMGQSPSVALRELIRLAPFFLVAGILTLVNIWFQRHGTGEVFRTAGFAERLLGAGGVVWFYLYKAFLPLNLSFIYQQWHIHPGNILWWLPLAAAVFVTAVLWRYRRSWARPLFFAWGFFCVSLIPVLGFVDVGFMRYSLVADHYQHLAIIGVIVLTASGWGVWQKQTTGRPHQFAIITACAATGLLMLLSYQQSRLYGDPVMLYQDTLKKNPTSSLIHNNLGAYFFQSGRQTEALAHYLEALRLKSDNKNAHYNLGVLLAENGQPQAAITHFRQALPFLPENPDAYNFYAFALTKAGNWAEAADNFLHALKIKPNDTDIQYNLGLALIKTNRLHEAIEQFQQALKREPDDAEIHVSLAQVLDKTGRMPEAIEHYKQALRLNPDCGETYFSLALVYNKSQQYANAIATAEKALALARSKGRTQEAKKIKRWLKFYRQSHP